jgi:hypothetical protein
MRPFLQDFWDRLVPAPAGFLSHDGYWVFGNYRGCTRTGLIYNRLAEPGDTKAVADIINVWEKVYECDFNQAVKEMNVFCSQLEKAQRQRKAKAKPKQDFENWEYMGFCKTAVHQVIFEGEPKLLFGRAKNGHPVYRDSARRFWTILTENAPEGSLKEFRHLRSPTAFRELLSFWAANPADDELFTVRELVKIRTTGGVVNYTYTYVLTPEVVKTEEQFALEEFRKELRRYLDSRELPCG